MPKPALVILVIVCCVPLLAQEPPRQNPQVTAALADAFDKLDRRVLAATISPAATVQDLVDRAGGRDELLKTLRSAQQVGGPRWLDDQTVQIRIEIDGGRVARTLLDIARKNPTRSPIEPKSLEKDLSSWSERSFAATGLSSSSGEIAQLQAPAADRAWAGVSDQARRDALSAARDHAVERVLDSLGAISLAPDTTLDQALNVPEVNQAIRGWLASRPVKAVEFQDDLTVRITLATPPDELWQALKSALSQQKQVPLPNNQAGWDMLEGQVTTRLAPAVGVGTVQPQNPGALVKPRFGLPLQPPGWANQYLDAEATSPAIRGGNQLKTARAAEAMAMAALRRKVDALPLDPNATLAQAQKQDPRIEQAVIRAMKHARPYQVDYDDRGAVTVHVSINLGDLWAHVAGR